MKKAYSKPQIVFDSFELSQSIAAGCEAILSNALEGSCPLTEKVTGLEIFSNGTCGYYPPNENDQLCYDVPYPDFNVYSS